MICTAGQRHTIQRLDRFTGVAINQRGCAVARSVSERDKKDRTPRSRDLLFFILINLSLIAELALRDGPRSITRQIKIRADLGFIIYSVSDAITVGLKSALFVRNRFGEKIEFKVPRAARQSVRRRDIEDSCLRRRDGKSRGNEKKCSQSERKILLLALLIRSAVAGARQGIRYLVVSILLYSKEKSNLF